MHATRSVPGSDQRSHSLIRPPVQAKHTSVLTLACTVVTSFGLVVICTWIAYEQWGRFTNRGHGVVQRLRSQLGSPAISIEENAGQDRGPGTDASANADHDPEHQGPVRQKTETSEFRRVKAGLMTTVRGAARVLIRGMHSSSLSINLPHRPTLADLRADATQILPFKLLFDKQAKVLGRTQGEVRDLEFSYDGRLLAVTRLAIQSLFRGVLTNLRSFDNKTRYSSTVMRAFIAQNAQEQHRIIIAPAYNHFAGKICHQLSW
jgi:hypothetical protein